MLSARPLIKSLATVGKSTLPRGASATATVPKISLFSPTSHFLHTNMMSRMPCALTGVSLSNPQRVSRDNSTRNVNEGRDLNGVLCGLTGTFLSHSQPVSRDDSTHSVYADARSNGVLCDLSGAPIRFLSLTVTSAEYR